MKLKHSSIHKNISIIFSFFLSLFSFLLICLLTVQITVLNPKFAIRVINKTDYSFKLSKQIKDELISCGQAGGVSKEFFDELITDNMVKQDSEKAIRKIYSGNTKIYQTSDFEYKIYNSLLKYAKEKGYLITENEETSLKMLAKECTEIYSNCINIKYLNNIARYIPVLSNLFLILIVAITILNIILLITIFKINHYKHRAYRYYIYAFSGTALMTLFLALYGLLSKKINYINILSTSLYDFIVSYFRTIGMYYLYFSTAIVILILFLSLTYAKRKNDLLKCYKK